MWDPIAEKGSMLSRLGDFWYNTISEKDVPTAHKLSHLPLQCRVIRQAESICDMVTSSDRYFDNFLLIRFTDKDIIWYGKKDAIQKQHKVGYLPTGETGNSRVLDLSIPDHTFVDEDGKNVAIPYHAAAFPETGEDISFAHNMHLEFGLRVDPDVKVTAIRLHEGKILYEGQDFFSEYGKLFFYLNPITLFPRMEFLVQSYVRRARSIYCFPLGVDVYGPVDRILYYTRISQSPKSLYLASAQAAGMPVVRKECKVMAVENLHDGFIYYTDQGRYDADFPHTMLKVGEVLKEGYIIGGDELYRLVLPQDPVPGNVPYINLDWALPVKRLKAPNVPITTRLNSSVLRPAFAGEKEDLERYYEWLEVHTGEVDYSPVPVKMNAISLVRDYLCANRVVIACVNVYRMEYHMYLRLVAFLRRELPLGSVLCTAPLNYESSGEQEWEVEPPMPSRIKGDTVSFILHITADGTEVDVSPWFYSEAEDVDGLLDWGDASDVVTLSPRQDKEELKHVYSSPGDYALKIGGKVRMGVLDSLTPYAVQTCLTEVHVNQKKCPILGFAPGMGTNKEQKGVFLNCVNLKSVDFSRLLSNREVINQESVNTAFMYSGCTSLTFVPQDIFAHLTYVRHLSCENMFTGCTGLTSAIPAIFARNKRLETLNCSNFLALTTGVPGIAENFFSSIPQLKKLTCNGFFQSSRIAAIPPSLFRGLGELLDLECVQMFAGCGNLTGEIPADFFSPMVKLTDLNCATMFASCPGLTGGIPEELFRLPSVTHFLCYSMFQNCTGLDGEIPATLFSALTQLVNRPFSMDKGFAAGVNCSYMFAGDTKLGGSAVKFPAAPGVTHLDFSYMYKGTAITEIPADLTDGLTELEVLYCNNAFEGCTSITALGALTEENSNAIIRE